MILFHRQVYLLIFIGQKALCLFELEDLLNWALDSNIPCVRHNLPLWKYYNSNSRSHFLNYSWESMRQIFWGIRTFLQVIRLRVRSPSREPRKGQNQDHHHQYNHQLLIECLLFHLSILPHIHKKIHFIQTVVQFNQFLLLLHSSSSSFQSHSYLLLSSCLKIQRIFAKHFS